MTVPHDIVQSDPKEAKRQVYRTRMARNLIANMAAESGMLGLFALAGTIPYWIAGAFFIASTGSALGFFLFIKSGRNQRLRDRGMLVPQLVVIAALQLVFLLLAPALSILFMLVLLVSSGFTLMEFTPRQFTIGWIIYASSTASALFIVSDRFSYPGVSPIETGLVWLFFVLTLRLLTLASAQFSRLREQLSEKNRQLEASLKEIELLANHDYLTGVFNRRNFMLTLEAEIQDANHTARPFCFAMLDLDHFKTVNDQHGHAIGDGVLKAFSNIIEQALRPTDKLARFGGEEFGIFLAETTLDTGIEVMERLRALIAGHDWETVSSGLAVTFSAGITGHAREDCTEAVLKRADDALYSAKRTGRNRVVSARDIEQIPRQYSA
jgi:diguanylate cyclase (GGDEF)-like protein